MKVRLTAETIVSKIEVLVNEEAMRVKMHRNANVYLSSGMGVAHPTRPEIKPLCSQGERERKTENLMCVDRGAGFYRIGPLDTKSSGCTIVCLNQKCVPNQLGALQVILKSCLVFCRCTLPFGTDKQT